jgi:hypothetical protein
MMSIDVIEFGSGESLFRPSEEHEFAEGYCSVTRISTVIMKPPTDLSAAPAPLIKNLCGRFTTFVEGFAEHAPVSKRARGGMFGRHNVMHHLHGTVNVHCGVAYFKGCCGFDSLRALSRDLFLDTPSCEVHMGVFKTFLGRHVQTSHGCYLESMVAKRFRCLRVCQRLLENCQVVKLRVDKFDEEELPHLSGSLAPTSLDLSVTNTGVLLMRFSWGRCCWTQEAEAAVLRFCTWMAVKLRECC